jgi:hypothetical protein
MASKYDVSNDEVFTVLDLPVPCSRCGEDTLTLFRGGICSRCLARAVASAGISQRGY